MEKKYSLKEKEKLAELLLVKAFSQLEKEQLLYSEIFKRINFVITPDFKMAIGGIGYDPKNKKVYCYLNTDALITNSEFKVEKDILTGKEKTIDFHTSSSINDASGLLEHEASHMLLDHIFYTHHDKDHKDFNRAKDYVINDGGFFLAKRYSEISNPENNSILNGGCFFSDIRDKIPEFKNKTANDFTSVEIYEILKKNQDKLPQKSGFDKHGAFKVTIDENGDAQISEENIELTEAEAQEISNEVKSMVKAAINSLKDKGLLNKAIGQLKGEICNKISQLIKTTTDKDAALNFTHSLKNDRKYSFKKINKRYPYIAQGRASDKKPILVLLLDTSGSMDNPEIRMMMGDQLCQLLAITKQLHVVVGDTILQFSKHIESEDDFNIEEIEFKGGGGTDLQFGWDYAQSIEADGVVCHTDGYISDFDDKEIPTMFYLYGEGHREISNYDNYKVYPID